MSSILAVHAAIRAPLATLGVPHWPGQAPTIVAATGEPPVAPWIVSGFALPDITPSEAAQGVAKTGTVTVTAATLTESATNHLMDRVDDLLDGLRVTVPGWTIGALLWESSRGPYPAGLTALDTNLAYQVARASWRFTYSRIPD